MSYFGWLTKGRCEISGLDILTLFTEIGILALIIFIALYVKARTK